MRILFCYFGVVFLSGNSNKSTGNDQNPNSDNKKINNVISERTKTSTGSMVQSTSIQNSKKKKMSHPGIDYGFQTADLRYITIPSQRGTNKSICEK